MLLVSRYSPPADDHKVGFERESIVVIDRLFGSFA